jgi:hypothetical protein
MDLIRHDFSYYKLKVKIVPMLELNVTLWRLFCNRGRPPYIYIQTFEAGKRSAPRTSRFNLDGIPVKANFCLWLSKQNGTNNYGECLCRCTLWPRHWLEVSGQLHAPAALPPGKCPPSTPGTGLDSNFNTFFAHPVGICYTDCATAALERHPSTSYNSIRYLQ